jgi:hypothetical protein
MKLKLSTISLGVVLLLTCVGPAFAQTSLYITNNSFEYPASSAQHIYITGGSPGTSGYMAGWTTVATQAGYWDTRNTNGSLSGVTNVDGAQVLEVYNVGSGAAGYIYQELTNKWVAGATYTMTARAGQPNPPGNPANVGDTFSLDANNSGTLSQLSSTTISTNGGQEGLLNYTVTYTATGSEPGDGHIVVAFHVPTTTSTGGMWIDDFALNVVLPDPSVVTQPISQTNVSGSTVSFSVNVYGASQLSYQWQATNSATGGFTNLVNGGVFSGATTNVLTLAGITTNQSLTYRVVATDTAGSVTSAPATLTVLTIPIINAEPVSQTVVSGSTVAYTVSASGVGTLNYQWQATNSAAGGFTNIVGATTNVLTLASVTTNSALSYQVIVANANGSVTSAPPATLTVLPSTTLVDVQFDGSYNLSTSTSGLGPVQTGAAILGATGDEWNVETVPYYVTSASLISGGSLTNTIGTASGLTLTVTQPNGNPVYTATYNNKVVDPNTTNLMSSALESFNYYASSQTFNISIGGLSAYTNSPFTLVIYAADPNSPVTETLAITNGATGGNTASALTTSSASGSLTNSPGGVGVSYNTFVGTITNGTLSFTVSGGVADGHTGVNGFQLLLSPSVAPIITTEPASQTNIAGSTAVFSVVAAGGGALTYQWQATNSATGGFTNVVNGGQISGATSNTLAISNLSTNWALAYQVVVSSGGFSITSTPAAYLTVLTIPVITTQPASISALAGSPVTFTVVASGVGTLTYQWQATNSATGGFTNIVGATTNFLTLASVTTNLSPIYQVIVANANGSVTSSPALLTVDSATRLIDVDLGTSAGIQTGAAVIGAAGDVWNGVAGGGTVSSLVDSTSNIVSNVQLVFGGFNNFNYNQPYGGGGTTPMDAGTTNLMQDFDFYFDGAGGHPNLTLSISNLTEYVNSPFALVVYGALGASQGDTMTLSGAAGGNSASTLTTSADTRQLSAGIGHAYNIFTGTLTNSTLTVTLNTNLSIFYGCNGFQLLLSPTLPLIITNAPVSQGVSAGQPASFSVGVLGTAPFSYQWQATNSATGGFTNLVNGGVISGANTNVLTISAVSTNWALAYRVIVTNSSQGSVTSSPAVTLTVLPAPALVGEWFTGAQSLADQSGFTPPGTHDGIDDIGFNTAQWGTSNDVPVGHTGYSIAFDGTYAVGITNSLNTDSNYQATFDLTLSKKMTIAFWAKYTAPLPSAFVAKNGNSAGWQFQSDTTTTNPEFTLKGTSTANLQSTSNVTDGNWHHYAGTWDGTTGIRSVYIDGVLTASLTSDLGTMTTASNYRLVLGGIDTVGTGDANITAPFFTGQLFDVRVYNYALTQAQVQALAGVTPTVSTNAYLSSLTVSPAGTLSPTFASNVLSYVTTEAYGNTPTITVVDADLTATNHLVYLGATNLLASGVASSALTLNSNPAVTNVVKVVVTAQDGVTTQSYLVNVLQLPSQTKPVLANTVSSGSLTLNWPLDHLGYRLLTQTNNLAKGVSANTNDWATVVGSSLTNTFTVPIVKTNLNQYYRLIYP